MLSSILVLGVVTAACLIGVRLSAFRKKRHAHRVTNPPPIINHDDPDHPFYQLCLQAGFRYIGEQAPALVHGVHVRMERENEFLFARVPVSESYPVLRSRHQRCALCERRLFDLYVTGPETILPPGFYGKYRAHLIGRVCGACGQVDFVDDVPVLYQYAVDDLRQRLRAIGNGPRFIETCASQPKAAP